MTAKRVASAIGLITLTSGAVAAIFMRVPALWIFMPTWLSTWVIELFNIESQEIASSTEFLVIWLLCFGLLATAVLASMIFKRRGV